MSRSTIFLLLGASVAAAIGQMLFRFGARDRSGLIAFVNPYIVLGMLFYAAGMVAWIYALSKEEMVTVYAFTALTFVLVYLGGVFLFGEHINTAKSIGVALVMAGLYFVSSN
jgi:drug/metabolite transporter (DMT)-like permease